MRYFLTAFVACAILAACGNPIGLPLSASNVVDTATLYALTGTPIAKPSGYSMLIPAPVRTDLVANFDVAFDIDTTGRALLLPTAALKMGQQSGFQISAQDFDSIRFAPTGNYNLDSAQVVHQNTVLLAHSVSVPCSFGGTAFFYAKLHVLAINPTTAYDSTAGLDARAIKFEILTDRNCGYRGLQPGLPRN